jgi:hypothetical protein
MEHAAIDSQLIPSTVALNEHLWGVIITALNKNGTFSAEFAQNVALKDKLT